jgi:hypothetical protein
MECVALALARREQRRHVEVHPPRSQPESTWAQG